MSAAPVQLLRLTGGGLSAEIDPGRGSDILSLVHLASGVQVLFESPWRRHADRLRAGDVESSSIGSEMVWMEHYRGGWQTLFPNAGPPRDVAGAQIGFHGELSTTAWDVVERGEARAALEAELFTVPVRVRRTIELDDGGVSVVDELENTSGVHLHVDYSSHPAFGGEVLDGDCVIQTGARRFTEDPGAAAGSDGSARSHPLPWAPLTDVPPPGTSRGMFGWLSEFDAGWASIVNSRIGLAVRLDWDAGRLPYAWIWQELNASEGFPWFGRARTVAIEPSSTQTSGPERTSVLRIAPHERVRIPVRLSITTIDSREQGKRP